MSTVDVKVPNIGDFREVEVTELLVKVGDSIEVDQSLVTVESDKASMEIPSSHAGVVQRISVKIGEKVSEGSMLVVLDLSPFASINDDQAIRSVTNFKTDRTRVFIVHGHGELIKIQAARLVEKLGFEAIILHEQASRGKTIIEKIEAYTNVGFAIVLYTADDKGNAKTDADAGRFNDRARQNVVFEHGYLMAKLGRDRVVPLVSGSVELPGDVSGVVYVSDQAWQLDIAREMKSAGYAVDFNKLIP